MKESDPNQLASNRSVYASPFFTLDTQQQFTDGNILTEQQYDEQTTSKINQLFSPHGLLNSNKFAARFNANSSQTHREDYQNILLRGTSSQQQQISTIAKKSQPGFIRDLQFENEIIDIADYDDDSMSKDSQSKQQAKSNASDQSRRPRKSSDIESIGDANPQEPGGDEAHKRTKTKSHVSKNKTRIYDLDALGENYVQPISKGQLLWAIVKRDIYQAIKFKNIVDFSIAEKNKLRFKGTSEETARVKDPVFFIMPDSWFKYLWDMLTGFIQIYYPIVIPLRISFGVPVKRSWFWDIGLESIFLMDMVFSCITGVLTGGEIVKSKRILMRKYARVSTLILLCVHLLSCLWIQAGREPDSGESYNLPEKFKRIGWISHYHPHEANEDGTIYGSVYVSAYYYVTTTIATIGYGDYSSLTVAEELFTMFCEFFGIALFGYISGGLVSAVQISLLKGQLKKSEKRAEFDQWLFQREKNKLEPLNHRLLQNLRAINHFNQENNFSDFFHETQCFHYLPKEQKRRVFNLLFTDIATFFGAFFRNISELAMIQEIFEYLHPLTFLPEEEIIKYRSLSRGIYFLVSGKVHISCRKRKTNKIPAKQRTIPQMQGTLREMNKKQEEDLVYFRKLSPGSFFGEFCVLDKYSSFEFVAGEKEPLFLLFIPKLTFQEICGKYKENYTWIKKFAFYRFKYFKMEKNDFEKKLNTYETIKKELTANSKKGSFFLQAKNEEKKDKNDSKDQVNFGDADNLNSQKPAGFEILPLDKKSETNNKKLVWKLQGQKTISPDNILDSTSILKKSQNLETAKKISQQAKRESKIANQLIGEEISEEEEKSREDSFKNRISVKRQIQDHSDDNHDFLHSKESDFESATPATTKVFMDTQKNTEEKRIASASLIQFDTKELVTSQSIEEGTQEKQLSNENLKNSEDDRQQVFDVMISPDEISFSNQNSNTQDTAAHHIDYLLSSNNLNLQSQSQEGEEQKLQEYKNSQQFSSPGDQINSPNEMKNCQEETLLGRAEAGNNQNKFSKSSMRQLFQQTKTIQFEDIQNDLKDRKDVNEEKAEEENKDKNTLHTDNLLKRQQDYQINDEKTNVREEFKDIKQEKSTITIKDIFGGQHKQSTQRDISRNQTQGNDNKEAKDIDRFSLVMISSSSSSNSSRNQSEQEKNTQNNKNQLDIPFDYGKEDYICDEDDYENEDENNGEGNMDEVLEMVKLEKEERQVRRAFRNKTSKNSSEEMRLNQLQVKLAETAGLRLPSENALSSSHLKNVAQHKLFKSLLQKKIDVLVRKAEMIQSMQSSKKVKFTGQSNEENGNGGDFNRNMKSMGSMKMQSAMRKQNTLKSLKTKKQKTNQVGNTYDQQRENVQRKLLRSQDISGSKRDQEDNLQFEEDEGQGEEAGTGSKIPCEEQFSSDSCSFQSSIQQRDEQNTNLEFEGQKSKGQQIEAEIDKVFCSRAPNFELMLMIDKMKEEHRMKYQQDIQGDISDDYQNYEEIQNFDINNQEDNNLENNDSNCNNDLAHLDDSMEIPIDCIKPNFDFDDLQSIPGYLESQLTILEKRIEQLVQNMYEECGSCVKKITKLSNLKESRKKHELKEQQEQWKIMSVTGTPTGAQSSAKYGRSKSNNTHFSPRQNGFMDTARNYLQTKKFTSQIVQQNSAFSQLDGQTVHLGNSLLFNLKQILSCQGKEFNFFSELQRRNKCALLQQKQQEEQRIPKKKLKKSKSEKQQGIFNGNQDRRKSKHMSIMQFPEVEKLKLSRKSNDKTDENDNDETTKQPNKLVLSEAAKVKEEFHKMFAMLRSRTEGYNGSSNSSLSNSLD